MSDAPALPVSVVIPVHDRAELLARAVAGVRGQTRPPAEIVVVDDCSGDGSAEIAERLGCRVVRHEHNRGAAAARNTGIEAASQEWLAMLDSDDEWLPRHLEVLWAARASHDIVTTSALLIDPDGRPTQLIGPPERRARTVSEPAQLLYPENIFVASGALVRRDAVRDVGGYDTSLRYAEDFDLWTRVLRDGTGTALPEMTVLIRTHPGRKSSHAGGPSAAQQRITRRVAGETGDQTRAQRRLGVRAWDDLRRARRDGEGRTALGEARTIAADPQRVVGVVGIWFWRQRMGRRSRAFCAGGRARVAVLSWPSEIPLPTVESHERLEDWRGDGLGRVLVRLLVSPPHTVVAARPLQRRLAALLRCPERDPGSGLLCDG